MMSWRKHPTWGISFYATGAGKGTSWNMLIKFWKIEQNAGLNPQRLFYVVESYT
jgi:hypothetical protein